ncbi:hypothetical protein NC652_029259 [Populus alba x Populus x berolinensis]|nr:hypothetical protein NC652_029259 [Populus alba x Populus x berolinensis]
MAWFGPREKAHLSPSSILLAERKCTRLLVYLNCEENVWQLQQHGSGLLAVEVIDDTVEAEVDGTDPNLKIDEAVKKSVDAETEKFLFPSEFSIAKAVAAALMLLLATLLAEALDHEF